jgi:DNA topoisomerase VI subunit B
MAKQIKEINVLIAQRVPPGDGWSLIGEDIVYKSLTETLEAHFQKTKEPCEFRLAPLKGELYMITTKEETVKVEPPKKFNIYGDY